MPRNVLLSAGESLKTALARLPGIKDRHGLYTPAMWRVARGNGRGKIYLDLVAVLEVW